MQWDRPTVIRDPSLDAIGIAFRRARAARGLTQRQLAERSSVPQSTISRLENGKMPSVRASHLTRLVTVLGRVVIEADRTAWFWRGDSHHRRLVARAGRARTASF